MQAFFGFKDSSGDWFLIIETEKCTGCGACVEVCPAHILEVGDNEFDPLSEDRVKDVERKKIRYACALCKPGFSVDPVPCVAVCEPGAISHSDGWKRSYGQE
jgi:ferredoxin